MKRVHLLATATAAALMALSVASCGSSDDDGGGSATASSTPATTASASAPGRCENVKLTYQLGYFPNAQYVGYLYALDRGYFADEGIDMTMKPGGPTVNPALQLAQGNVDMADLPLADALNAAANGGKIKLIAQTAQQNPIRYVSWKESEIEEPADLDGKVVGTQQTGNLAPELTGMLESAGLDADAVEQKSISFNADDFIARRVDVFPLRIYAHISMLESKGFRYPEDFNVLDPNRYDASIADEGEYVNVDYANDNPEALPCVLRGMIRGWSEAARDPAGAFAAVKRYSPRGAFSDEDIRIGIDETLMYATTNPRGERVEPQTIDIAYLTDSAEKLKQYGVVRNDVDLDAFIDPAPLEQARAAAGGS